MHSYKRRGQSCDGRATLPGLVQFGPGEVLASGASIELHGNVARASHPGGGYIEFPRSELFKRDTEEPENHFDEAQRFFNALWQTRLNLYRDLFPWVGQTLREIAGVAVDAPLGFKGSIEDNKAFVAAWEKYFQGSRSGDERIVALLQRATKEWHDLTGLPWGLGTVEEWYAAAEAAGVPTAEQYDFERAKQAVRRWVIGRKARLHEPSTTSAAETINDLPPQTIRQPATYFAVPRAYSKVFPLLKKLNEIPPGTEHATEYHRAAEGILSALFVPSLAHPKIEKEIHDGRK